MTDDQLMQIAIEEARRGAEEGEVPIGALAVYDGLIIASAHNAPIARCDPTAHAEVLVLRAAVAFNTSVGRPAVRHTGHATVALGAGLWHNPVNGFIHPQE